MDREDPAQRPSGFSRRQDSAAKTGDAAAKTKLRRAGRLRPKTASLFRAARQLTPPEKTNLSFAKLQTTRRAHLEMTHSPFQ